MVQICGQLRQNYAEVLRNDNDATLDDLREAVTTLEEIEPIARRVLGSAHPLAEALADSLRRARTALRETQSSAREDN